MTESENGFHPLEESPYGEKDNALSSAGSGARNLQSLCLGSDVGDEHRPHTGKKRSGGRDRNL
jgi:hypothetical protein